MRTRVKAAVAVALIICGGAFFGAGAQMEMDNYGAIIFHTGYPRTIFSNGTGDLFLSLSVNSNYGWFFANRAIIYGNLSVTGTKNFIHPHPTDNSKAIRYVAIESGESVTLARGTARTVNGEAIVTLPEHFSLVTNKDAPITVHLTPEGAPAQLYVKQKSRDQIVIAMKNADFTEFKDIDFSYQVTGVRDGFENLEAIVSVEDLMNVRQGIARDDVQTRIKALGEKMDAVRESERERVYQQSLEE